MFRSSALVAVAFLAACQPSVPDSGGGVGFQDYNSYIRNSSAPPSAAPPAQPAAQPGFDPASASAAIDRADGRATPAPLDATQPPVGSLQPDRPRADAPAGIKVESGEMAAVTGHSSISDEQDFEAVKTRETIASDKERIEQNRAQYVVVQPRDLPVRPGDTGPNIVDFALATTNGPGTQLYTRRGGSLKNPYAACGRFASPDLAQAEFLAKGGPEKDKLGIDPDGDGFACGWDPRPFRTALQ